MNKKETQSQLKAVARTAGFWYLMLAISGILGFLVFHSKVFDADPQQTLTNLTEKETTARIRLLLEIAIVVSQALTAVWFFRLFRNINDWAALATGIWGTVNAVVIMISAISMRAAIELAASSYEPGDKVATIDLLNRLISSSWAIGGLFFGLWLIPLGYVVSGSKRMPVWLGRTLMIGGVGYILSTVIHSAGFSGSWVNGLTIPATIGEFWMIGYLLIFGIRPENEQAS